MCAVMEDVGTPAAESLSETGVEMKALELDPSEVLNKFFPLVENDGILCFRQEIISLR